MATDIDSIPRLALSDLFLALNHFRSKPMSTLENVRVRFCLNRKKKWTGDLYWSTARDNAVELQRLGLLDANAFPKDKRAYERMRHEELRITPKGHALLDTFHRERGAAYEQLFKQMFTSHRYLAIFVKALIDQVVFLPVLTSLKAHVSPRYTSNSALASDLRAGSFDKAALLNFTAQRLGRRALEAQEQSEIEAGIDELVQQSRLAALSDEGSDLAINFIQRLNDIVLPAVLRARGLAFDFRTHRTLWNFGEEWKIWQATGNHPNYDGRLVFLTATIRLTPDASVAEEIIYDSGLKKTGEDFLKKLYSTYQKLQELGRGTYAHTWELRSMFCYEHRCQESVFDELMRLHYGGSDEYSLHMEACIGSQNQTPLKLGNREIGLVRVLRRLL